MVDIYIKGWIHSFSSVFEISHYMKFKKNNLLFLMIIPGKQASPTSLLTIFFVVETWSGVALLGTGYAPAARSAKPVKSFGQTKE